MRILAPLFCVLLACSALAHGQAEQQDPYAIHLIQGALETALSQPGVNTSFVEKQLQRRGDAVSVTLLKILDERDLTEEPTVEAVLDLIRQAFSSPKLISLEEDKKPKVTMFLLKYLQHSVSGSKTQGDVKETINFVNEKIKAAAGAAK
jgi:hypothetical protein